MERKSVSFTKAITNRLEISADSPITNHIGYEVKGEENIWVLFSTIDEQDSGRPNEGSVCLYDAKEGKRIFQIIVLLDKKGDITGLRDNNFKAHVNKNGIPYTLTYTQDEEIKNVANLSNIHEGKKNPKNLNITYEPVEDLQTIIRTFIHMGYPDSVDYQEIVHNCLEGKVTSGSLLDNLIATSPTLEVISN